MSDIQYATFVKNEFQLIAAFLALRSLQLLEVCAKPPIVWVPKPLFDEVEVRHPKLKIQNMIRKLGGDMKEGFAGGFNPRNSFRASLLNLSKRAGDDELLYFAPNTMFFANPMQNFADTDADVAVARAPDQYWPERELYGPTPEAIWTKVVQSVDGKPEDWFDDFPKEYWRRYPCASTHLIYAKKPVEFAQMHMNLSKELIEAEIFEFEGQGRNLVEPTIAAAVIRANGKIAPIDWDHGVVAYDNFIQLVLRMRQENRSVFNDEILNFQGLRSFLKKVPEYKAIFYHNNLVNSREKFDEIESEFSPLRVNMLIERRKLNKKIKSIVREAKKSEQEVADQNKGGDLAKKLATEDGDLDAL